MIHPTVFIDERAKIGPNVFVGPGAVILGEAEVGEDSYIHNHATIGSNECKVVLGKRNIVFPGAVIGGVPQDLKYGGEKTELHIGNDNTFREHVTVNTGTKNDNGKTIIGNNNLVMSYTHIAHDCVLGDHIVVSSSCLFSGHVVVENHVKISGYCGFVQFVRLGEHCYVTGRNVISKDIIPYTIARRKHYDYATSSATNKIGLERSGFSLDEINLIHKAIRMILTSDKVLEDILKDIETSLKEKPSSSVEKIINFIKNSKRGVAR